MTYRLGVDVGGTFTDVLLIDERTGGTYRAKTASTPDDQSVGVLRGIEKVCGSAGITLADITQVLHGTTVATNAILEGKGARVGLVTTQGFRQVLQIARSFVPGGLAGWIIWPKPEPLASLEDTVEAIERIAADGSVVTALDDDDIRAKLRTLRASGVEALTISLINSYANAAHEQRIAAIAAEELPGRPALGVQRGAAGAARVRAHHHRRGQQLRPPAGLPLHRQPGGQARRRRRRGRPVHPAQRRRPGQRGERGRQPGLDAAVRPGRRRGRRGLGRRAGRLPRLPHLRHGRHLHRRGAGTGPAAADRAGDHGRRPQGAGHLGGRADRGRGRRVHRARPAADPGAAGRPAVGRGRARARPRTGWAAPSRP